MSDYTNKDFKQGFDDYFSGFRNNRFKPANYVIGMYRAACIAELRPVEAVKEYRAITGCSVPEACRIIAQGN